MRSLHLWGLEYMNGGAYMRRRKRPGNSKESYLLFRQKIKNQPGSIVKNDLVFWFLAAIIFFFRIQIYSVSII